MTSPERSPFAPRECSTVVELLRRRALQQPGQTAYTFLADGEQEEASLTYAQLDARARAIAALLQSAGAAGGRALLLYPSGLDYVAAFFGCLYAGVVAVTAYPPRPSKQNRNFPRLRAIVGDCRPSVALGTSAILAAVERRLAETPDLAALRWLSTDELPDSLTDGWREPRVSPDTLAFLQYTSGSTAAPKGVMVSHGNLLHNEELISHAFGQTERSVIVGWLPLYHDMGLIGNVLHPLYLGAACYLMSPTAFLLRPMRWLQAVSRYRATTSGGPNFAYDLCARKITEAQRAALDLSSWTTAFNGAEPVRAETMRRFAEAFAPCGFRRESFAPCYGLAEATLIVTGARPEGLPLAETFDAAALERNRALPCAPDAPGARALVNCGGALPDQRLEIVDPETGEACAPGAVGEVWVAGPSVTRGYWNRAEETAATFGARLAATGEGPFLRTGDLGFVQGGGLFVTGRLKDLIVIRGRNHYPQDIELTAERSHAALRAGCGAAFSFESGGEEQLVIVQEVDPRAELEAAEVLEAIREAVAFEHDVAAHAILLVAPGSVPKTSSGKVQRHACRQRFLSDALEVLGGWRASSSAAAADFASATDSASAGAGVTTTGAGAAPTDAGFVLKGATEIEAWLVAHVAARFGVEVSAVDANQPLTRYGFDSLAAIELMHAVETQTGVSLSMSAVLQNTTLAQIAAEAAALMSAPDKDAANRQGLGSTPRRMQGADRRGVASPEKRVMKNEHAAETNAGPTDLLDLLAGESGDGYNTFLPSFAQQRFWFLDQLEPGNPLYNIPAVVRIGGNLNVAAMEQALTEIVRRHESLRTTFRTLDAHPVQVVGLPFAVHVQVEDLSALPEAERDAAAVQLLLAKAREPFDLARGPLLRPALVRTGPAEYLFSLTMHHIVSDGWSFGVLIREVITLYEAFVAGKPSPLPELEIQYPDYALWQREWLQGDALDEQLAYWKRQLAAPPVLELPGDRRRPPVQSFAGAVHQTRIPAPLYESLHALGRREGVTLFMTLLAGFKALLWRYTGQDDLVVGTPVAGRTRVEMEPLIGLFVNTLALRTDLSGDPTFGELLARVRGTALGAYAHQDVPFEKLVEELQPERSLSHAPIFQVMIMLQNTPRPALTMAGLPLGRVDVDTATAKFDLTLLLEERDGGITAQWEYSTDLFDAETVERMAGHFETLLEGAAADPTRRISGLPLLSEAERRHITIDFNETRRAYPPALRIDELFEAQAAHTPDAVALVYEGERLTYAELNARAEQVTHRLRELGVGSESRVGVLLGRTPALVAALLGVMKAGAAYVPLDPDYPQERVRFMLEDAAVSALVTQSALLSRLPEQDAPVLCIDAQVVTATDTAEAPSARAVSAAGPDSLAYVIYTSGSTGTPKGMAIEHRSVSTLLHWAHETFSAEELSGVLASTSICFDLSIFELFAPLTCGGSVILADNALALASHPAASEVTLINTVPSAMAELVRGGSVPESVLTVNLAGEPLKRALVEQVYAGTQAARVLNLYGPSEDTTYSTFAIVARGAVGEPTIGRPVANTQAYLLDRHLRLVPRGAVGELYLGGEGLSRGYLNRPALTAERYVPDSFSGEPGARLYRTGDLARWRRNGELEFLGRADHQVKVRGFRIELGEVEAALSAHEGVRACVVVAREDEPGDRRVVAYVAADELLSSAALRAHLRERLPDYMIPSVFVMLDELPLTPNGKVDRKALPAPEMARSESESRYVAPRTPTEEVLCGVWSEVLRVERVGVEDNFFELGGHSLLATRLMARTREAFGVELPLRALFETPTVSGLGAEIERTLRDDREVQTPALARAERDGALPLSFAQQRLWFLDQLEPGNPLYNVPVALRLEGALDADALGAALREVVRRHESLRTTFESDGARPAQVVSTTTEFAVGSIDLSALSPAERDAELSRLTTEEAGRPFDLARGPLLRASLLRLDEAEHVLLLTMHHIVSDGWSLEVLARELAALYEAYRRGHESPLAELPIQYADYSVWQRDWLQGDALEEQLTYWRRQLAGAPPALDLPTDRPHPARRSYEGASLAVELPSALTEELRAFSRRAGVTPFMTLLAAWQALLARYTGQTDIAVGVPIANRQRRELEDLIGLFVNTLVLRTDLSGDPTFSELLAHVRGTALEAYAHQDVPFEKLVEELQPERSLSRTPLFQVLFNWQKAAEEEFSAQDLRLRVLPTDIRTAKFDLTLTFFDAREELRGHLAYSTELFDEATIRRLASHYVTLLAAALRAPELRVAELPLLAEAERRQLLIEFNETRRDYGLDVCVHELFEQQVARTPDAPALAYEQQRLSYAELNARANRLAHHLRAHGVGVESLVGICMERAPELIVALLGVMKAGAAYVPLDPEYPQERVRFMLEDAGARVLLTQARLADSLPRSEGTHVVRLDADWPDIADEGAENVAHAATPDNLAYVIHTSGSTGQPKGAMLHHRGIVNAIRWMQEAHGIGASDRFLFKTSLNFDPSVWEIFLTLASGACVHVARPGGQYDAIYLARLIADEEITFAYFVPSMLRVFLEEPAVGRCASLRRVICGGEPLMWETMRRFSETLRAELYHSYGPTEISITASTWRCDPRAARRQVSIGYPRANTTLYVLDAEMQPVPVGITGELYVGGVGVGRGYLGDAALTAARFAPDPFSPEAGARLYRTGDLVRRAADGSLEFVARADTQVKLRGHRIELGEIESALAGEESVREAAAVIREEEGGRDRRLVAYVVAEEGAEPSAGRLRARLKERLPDYMIPSAFVFLDSLPLLPSGKVDRRALPAPGVARADVATYVAPRTPVEETLAALWADLLRVERVGVEDNFFDLGGHSLLATQLVPRVRESLGVDVPLRGMFESPTVAALARYVEEQGARAAAPPAPKIQARQRGHQNLQQLLTKLEQMADGEVRTHLDERKPL
jgi:amino acid adenylation domain-containing protein